MTSPWSKATVLLWWLLNLTESLGNSERFTRPSRTATWAIARKYLRFVELTMFQFFVAAVATALWLKVVHNKPLHPKDLNRKSITLVTFLNLVGYLAANLMHSMAQTRRMGDVIMSFEPVVMFVLLMIIGQKKTYHLSNALLLGITIMVLGSWLFMSAGDNRFNVCGVVAALVTGFAFSLRNIILRSISAETSHESPLQKYYVISVYGFLALVPVVLAKLLLTRILPLVDPRVLLRLTAFRVVDGFMSICVLQTIGPLFHAVLGIALRLCVTMVTVVYAHVRLSLSMLVGSTTFLAGLLYYLSKAVPPRGYENLKRIIVYVVLAFYFVFSANFFLDSGAPRATTHPSQLVRTFWTYDRPPTDEILLNIKAFREKMPSATHVHVFCATFRCMDKIRRISNPEITTSFLLFREIVQGSPLERWFSRHALHKVFSERHFEDHTHEAARLALLWHYGGVHVDPFLRIQEVPVRVFMHTSPWVSLISDNETGGVLRACNFSPRHPFITMLARVFVDHYENAIDSLDKIRNVVLDFRNTTSRTLLRFCELSTNNCPKVLGIKSSISDLKDATEGKREFVVVSEKSNADLSLTMENVAEVQFLPYVDGAPDGYPKKPNIKPNTTALLSSWWKGNQSAFPFLGNTNIVMLSARMDYRNWPTSEHLEYLRRRAPIGCLDMDTVTFLRSNGIRAYYSGGISLLAKSQHLSQIRRNGIYLVDVDEEVKNGLPSWIRRNAIFVDHSRSHNLTLNWRNLFKMSFDLVERYSTATLIITQNVRCALVSAAIDTPVIYINPTAIPRRQSEVNYAGLVNKVAKVFHIVEQNRLFADDTELITNSTEVIPNPNASLLMRLRATAWSAIRRHDSLRAAALRFGVVPFARPRSSSTSTDSSTSTATFHLIFTTSQHSSIVLEGLSYGETVNGAFVWRHWRCIEAIFHHHPFARVLIHSNTLSQSTFDVLTESGYDIQVRHYILAELASGTPADTFVRDEFPYAKEGEHWYSHETDLIRLLVLYKWGGIYMDTDIVVVRSLSDLLPNVVGWESNFNLNGAFLKFQKRHPFVEACLHRFSRHYSQAWADNGPLLISRVWRERSGSNGWNDVSVYPTQAFYMFFYRNIKKQCFEDTAGYTYKANLKILKTKAYVVHLYSKVTAAYGTKRGKIKEGTLCKHILNSFCVLCNEVY